MGVGVEQRAAAIVDYKIAVTLKHRTIGSLAIQNSLNRGRGSRHLCQLDTHPNKERFSNLVPNPICVSF